LVEGVLVEGVLVEGVTVIAVPSHLVAHVLRLLGGRVGSGTCVQVLLCCLVWLGMHMH